MDVDRDSEQCPNPSANQIDIVYVSRQQRKINRRRNKDNIERAAAAIKAAQDRINEHIGRDIHVEMELREQDMFLRQPEPGPELAEGVVSDHDISAQATASASMDYNPFLYMSDWRSFKFELMDEACVPGGVWDSQCFSEMVTLFILKSAKQILQKKLN